MLNYIKKNFEAGEPILLQNINLDVSYDNLCQQVKHLVDNKKLCRYMDGVYFLPKKTISGIPYSPSADSVAELKYICNKTDHYGCYTGHTLANMIGISEQVPQIREIVSNNSSAITRKVAIGKFIYIIRKSPILITNENFKTVMLLEVLKDIDSLVDYNTDASEYLKKFIKENKINKASVDKEIKNYPLRTYKAIYDMELLNVLT